MPNRKPNTLLAIIALVLLAAYLLFLGNLALAQFSPKCIDGVCPTLIEKILRAIAVFFAGLMVMAGAAWWIIFNVLPRREDPSDDERPSA